MADLKVTGLVELARALKKKVKIVHLKSNTVSVKIRTEPVKSGHKQSS